MNESTKVLKPTQSEQSIVLTAKEDLSPLYFISGDKKADANTLRIDFALTNRSIGITNLLYSYDNPRGMFLESVVDTLIADLSKKTAIIFFDDCAASKNYVKSNAAITDLLEQIKTIQEEAIGYAAKVNNEKMKDAWIKDYLAQNPTTFTGVPLSSEELNELYIEMLNEETKK